MDDMELVFKEVVKHLDDMRIFFQNFPQPLSRGISLLTLNHEMTLNLFGNLRVFQIFFLQSGRIYQLIFWLIQNFLLLLHLVHLADVKIWVLYLIALWRHLPDVIFLRVNQVRWLRFLLENQVVNLMHVHSHSAVWFELLDWCDQLPPPLCLLLLFLFLLECQSLLFFLESEHLGFV